MSSSGRTLHFECKNVGSIPTISNFKVKRVGISPIRSFSRILNFHFGEIGAMPIWEAYFFRSYKVNTSF
jgi:hypothetical protein